MSNPPNQAGRCWRHSKSDCKILQIETSPLIWQLYSDQSTGSTGSKTLREKKSFQQNNQCTCSRSSRPQTGRAESIDGTVSQAVAPPDTDYKAHCFSLTHTHTVSLPSSSPGSPELFSLQHTSLECWSNSTRLYPRPFLAGFHTEFKTERKKEEDMMGLMNQTTWEWDQYCCQKGEKRDTVTLLESQFAE